MRTKFGVLLVLAAGCASPGMAREEYQTRMARVSLGMRKAEFLAVFPEAEDRGGKAYPDGHVEVFEVRWRYYSFFPTGNPNRNPWTGNEGKPVWFYFFEGRLVQYGEPGDWPADPGKAIEVRKGSP